MTGVKHSSQRLQVLRGRRPDHLSMRSGEMTWKELVNLLEVGIRGAQIERLRFQRWLYRNGEVTS